MISGVILAAGLSRRMGEPKQFLRWRGATLLEHALDVASRSRLGEILLVLSPATAVLLEPHAYPHAIRVLNPRPEDGQSSSLKRGVERVSRDASGALVLMSDQPHVSVELLDALIRDFEREPAGALVPVYDGERGAPVLLGRPFFGLLSSLEGDTGARALLAAHPECVRTLEVGHLGGRQDIDTPEQYAQLLAGEVPAR